MNPARAKNGGSALYVGLVICPGLVYGGSGPRDANPLMVKVGKSAGLLRRRVKEHGSAGMQFVCVVGAIEAPPEGVHNCEKALLSALKSRRLRVGMRRAGGVRELHECHAADEDTIALVRQFFARSGGTVHRTAGLRPPP